MGLDYETLRAIKPDIILTTVNAWASGGEWSHKVGFDGLAQAASGNLYLSGPPGQPSRATVPYVDFSTATIVGAVDDGRADAPPRRPARASSSRRRCCAPRSPGTARR